jgi:hypothetical protein
MNDPNCFLHTGTDPLKSSMYVPYMKASLANKLTKITFFFRGLPKW